MIYIPNYETNNCVHIRDKDTIRVYERKPQVNNLVNYTDYYINSDYLQTNGQQQFTQYTTIPTCEDNITTNVFYRNDIDKILVVFLIILLICFFLPYKIISRMFGRWLKW